MSEVAMHILPLTTAVHVISNLVTAACYSVIALAFVGFRREFESPLIRELLWLGAAAIGSSALSRALNAMFRIAPAHESLFTGETVANIALAVVAIALFVKIISLRRGR